MCGFVTARIIFIVPQTYLPIYLTDTLNMSKVSIHPPQLQLILAHLLLSCADQYSNRATGAVSNSLRHYLCGKTGVKEDRKPGTSILLVCVWWFGSFLFAIRMFFRAILLVALQHTASSAVL